jgi:hypothetical protein
VIRPVVSIVFGVALLAALAVATYLYGDRGES